MFYIDNDSGVTVMPPVSAQRSAIVRWFSEGDGNNVITWPGMDWFNIVQAELLNTLEEAGIQPDKTKLNQLALSIKAIMNKNALLIKNNLSEIKTAGSSAQRTARENLGIYDASVSKKGLVQLSSATNSTSEALAATPKAVKAANDNANSRLAKNQNGADIQDKSAFLDNVGVTSQTFMKHNGELPEDANLNTYGPVAATLGTWGKSSSTNATIAKNFPEDSAVGFLEVFTGGNYNGTQRYTCRNGGIYIRTLSARWNGKDGPWSAWRNVQMTSRPLSQDIDLDTLGGAEHLGVWRNASAAIAAFTRNYPEEGNYGQGVLEVMEGGGYSRTQRYTTTKGNMYVRSLAATWDTSTPKWGEWQRVGYQPDGAYHDGDLNAMKTPGIYSVTNKAKNGPMKSGDDNLLGILEVIKRLDGGTFVQRYTTAGTVTLTRGRSFERTLSGNVWTEWREIYNSFSLAQNLGIGGAVATLSSLDWQTYDFVPGSLINVPLNNMTNIPDGMDWGVIDGNIISIAVGPSENSGSGRSAMVWRGTVSKGNYRFFMVRIAGNPGSRTITTRRVPIIDEAQTWAAKQTFSGGLSGELSGNATTATKLKTARKINNIPFDGTSDINLTPGYIGAYTKGESNALYVKDVRLGSQQYYGVNNWQTWNFQCPSGYVLSGINVQDTGSNSADNIAGVYYRPVQKHVNGTWYNVASI